MLDHTGVVPHGSRALGKVLELGLFFITARQFEYCPTWIVFCLSVIVGLYCSIYHVPFWLIKCIWHCSKIVSHVSVWQFMLRWLLRSWCQKRKQICIPTELIAVWANFTHRLLCLKKYQNRYYISGIICQRLHHGALKTKGLLKRD